MINVYIMSRTFFRNGVAPHIGVHGVRAHELDIGFVKINQLRRQQEHGIIINFLVRIKPPAKAGLPG
jgi:hypothetical protein